jgi:hypothetical protein
MLECFHFFEAWVLLPSFRGVQHALDLWIHSLPSFAAAIANCWCCCRPSCEQRPEGLDVNKAMEITRQHVWSQIHEAKLQKSSKAVSVEGGPPFLLCIHQIIPKNDAPFTRSTTTTPCASQYLVKRYKLPPHSPCNHFAQSIFLNCGLIVVPKKFSNKLIFGAWSQHEARIG